jgi:hypothetical protein
LEERGFYALFTGHWRQPGTMEPPFLVKRHCSLSPGTSVWGNKTKKPEKDQSDFSGLRQAKRVMMAVLNRRQDGFVTVEFDDIALKFTIWPFCCCTQ